MAELISDAWLFCRAVDSRYWTDVCDALSRELKVTSPDQAAALEVLRERFSAMAALLVTRLEHEVAELTQELTQQQQQLRQGLTQGNEPQQLQGLMWRVSGGAGQQS